MKFVFKFEYILRWLKRILKLTKIWLLLTTLNFSIYKHFFKFFLTIKFLLIRIWFSKQDQMALLGPLQKFRVL